MAQTDSPPRHDPYAALRHPDYRRLLTGSMLSMIGQEMQAVAVGWELYDRTGSTLALGLVGLVLVVPVLLLALPAGQVADIFARKRILLLAQSVMVLTSLGLTWTSAQRAPVGWIYVCLGIAGVAGAFARPARWALAIQVVPRADLANAVTWRSSSLQMAMVLGPALGGLILALAGRALEVYAIQALMSLLVIAAISRITPRPARSTREPVTLHSLLAGARFVGGTRLVLAAITLDMFAVLFGGATALLPVFARDILDVGPVGLGWLRAAPSIGSVTMALALAHRPPLRRAGPALLSAVAIFGLAMIVFGLSRSPGLSFLALLIAGAADNISMVVRGTLVQALTPEAMQGRVSAVNSVFIGLSNELGGFESGLTASWWGPVASVVVGGVGTLVVVVATRWIWPELARLGPLAAFHGGLNLPEPSPSAPLASTAATGAGDP